MNPIYGFIKMPFYVTWQNIFPMNVGQDFQRELSGLSGKRGFITGTWDARMWKLIIRECDDVKWKVKQF